MMQHATDLNLIRHRAYELWLERGAPVGSPDHDWINAERELVAPAPSVVAEPNAGVAVAPPPVVRKPRRARAIVTRSPASPAAEAFRALATESEASLPESEVRPSKAPVRPRRATQKRSA
jgi:hypothetical protein